MCLRHWGLRRLRRSGSDFKQHARFCLAFVISLYISKHPVGQVCHPPFTQKESEMHLLNPQSGLGSADVCVVFHGFQINTWVQGMWAACGDTETSPGPRLSDIPNKITFGSLKNILNCILFIYLCPHQHLPSYNSFNHIPHEEIFLHSYPVRFYNVHCVGDTLTFSIEFDCF